MTDPDAIARRLRRLYPRTVIARALAGSPDADPALPPLESYRDDPEGFCRHVLGVSPTADQCAIMRALPAYGRVKMEAGHGVGKTFIMACIVLWWFYTRNPSVVICSSPKFEHLRDVLWAEVRLLHRGARRPLPDFFIGPKAPEIFDTDEHWAKGYTTSKGEAYQGRHRPAMLFVFDEDEGIDPIYWTTAGTMYQPGQGHGWLTACNPVTTSSASFLESQKTDAKGNPKWKLFRLSSLDHPNVRAELRGEPPPVPNAVSLAQVDGWVKDWTTSIPQTDSQPGDLEWPPLSGRWYRPGPTFKSRVQGLRPTEGVDTVWSVAAWELACEPRWDPADCWHRRFRLCAGVDAAAYGDDDTAIHLRLGPLSLHHEAHNGWGPDRVAGRIKELCREWTAWYNGLAFLDRPPLEPEMVEVNIEFDGGFGVGVHSHAGEFRNWRGVTMGAASGYTDLNGNPMYANVRAEAWFNSVSQAVGGHVDLSRLPPEVRDRLRLELLAPFYQVRPDGSRLVEDKRSIKKRLGRSPDNADSFVLSHFPVPAWNTSLVGTLDREAW